MCTFPEYRACDDGCVDPVRDDANCGFCGRECPEGQHCDLAQCEAPLACSERLQSYDIDDMQASGGVAVDEGWLLGSDETLSVEHAFQQGPVVFRITARGLEEEPRPMITLTIGDTVLGPIRLRSTDYATYSLEYDSAGGTETVGIATKTELGLDASVAAVAGLEIEDCTRLRGLCEGGGYYLPEIRACAPPVCNEAEDCARDFAGPGFFGECVAGACQYPSCTDPGPSGLPFIDEYAVAGDFAVLCVHYQDLVFPRSNPRTAELEGTPDDFTCPDVGELTWEIERFSGEGSCVEVPVCGPDAASEISDLAPSPDDACCYFIARVCGA
jgi:hypothetical protein